MLKLVGRLSRLFVFISTIWFILATPLLAEDIAHRRIIGFSPDGNYFAFEQSGIENGSGAAYAHIFLIDTRRNKWVKGSPYRSTAIGRRKLPRARQKVRSAARRALVRYRIRKKGVVLASNPITELNSDPHRVEVYTRRTIQKMDEPLVFSIRESRVRTPRCRRFTRRGIKGFAIRVRRKGGRVETLHTDTRIPKSRGCPTSYSISDVIRLKKRDGGAVYAVIYSFIRSGRDGEERRFIAGGWHDDTGDYKEPEHYGDLYDYYGGNDNNTAVNDDFDDGARDRTRDRYEPKTDRAGNDYTNEDAAPYVDGQDGSNYMKYNRVNPGNR